MKTIICDLDNCIADDGWRIPRINWQKKGDARYHDYHLLSGFDKVDDLWLIEEMQKASLSAGRVLQVAFCTARPVAYEVITRHWLKCAGWNGFQLLMRAEGDRRTSPEVKQTQVNWLLDSNLLYGVKPGDLIHAFDDHPGVIEMYRANGIPATLRSIHSLNAFHDPLLNVACL